MIIPSQHASRVARGGAATPSGSAFTAGEFSFNDILNMNSGNTATTNTVTMPHGGTLAIASGIWEGAGYIYKNGVLQNAYPSPSMNAGFEGMFTYNANYARFNVSTGDQLYFSYVAPPHPFAEGFPVDIRNATSVPESFTGTLINRYNISKTGCFLTTAVVRHMGGLDNGPELTAMRMLRDHYSSVEGYAEEIQDYYTYSALIVNAINNSSDKEAIYLEIYATVKACESFVMAGQWEQAHDLYMIMYLDLKTKFIN